MSRFLSGFRFVSSWRGLVASLLVLAAPALLAGGAGTVPLETAAVMAPLDIRTSAEMQAFETLLDQAKAAGVDSVSVDVWWGKVERNGDQIFDWTYYDSVFGKIRSRGLKIAPILSFHQCGGGPGDDCDIPVPSWLWTHFGGIGLGASDLKFESETGAVQPDAIVPWATAFPAVLDEYRELMQAFGAHFGGMASDLTEINVSLGPTGELRYPAYNKSDGWNFPDRGNLQAYNGLARSDFRAWALNRFGGLSGVALRWGFPLANPDAIRPPGGHLPPNSGRRAQSFFDDNDHVDTVYGRDFIDWYNQSLVQHGRRVLLAADEALSGALDTVPLAMKIPGVHWQMMPCSPRPRVAEVTAGLVQTTLNLTAAPQARPDAYGYKAILDMVSAVQGLAGRSVILHFTAAEMDNDPACGNGNSMADALVFWISEGAQDRGIAHKGENALACVDTPGDDRSWQGVRNVYSNAPYRGFTLLRLVNGGCNPWQTDKTAYQSFISDYRGGPTADLTVHLAEWQFCPLDQGCRYHLHAWNGLNGSFPLTYEGFVNGRHWWKGTVTGAPVQFSFTFNNSYSWEGGPGSFDRNYVRATNGNDIYLLGRVDTSVRAIRP
jgi:hypothetical protein